MAVLDLSPPAQQAILASLDFLRNTTEIEDWEFQTRVGVSRDEFKEIIEGWPPSDDEDPTSTAYLVINNTLNEICNGIPVDEDSLKEAVGSSLSVLRHVYAEWKQSIR